MCTFEDGFGEVLFNDVAGESYTWVEIAKLIDLAVYLRDKEELTRVSGFHACNSTDFDLYYADVEDGDEKYALEWVLKHSKEGRLLCIDNPHSLELNSSPFS